VRMLVPPIVRRREMDRNLVKFFRGEESAPFRRAIADFCRYYSVKGPRIEWCEYIDWGKAAGKTFQDGRIHLVHPENWKRGRVYKSERMWVHTVYHELAHYLFWADAERKAETFRHRMVRGLKRRLERRRARTVVVARRKAASGSRMARSASPQRRKPRSGVAYAAGIARRQSAGIARRHAAGIARRRRKSIAGRGGRSRRRAAA
jgi:hypothetical protein